MGFKVTGGERNEYRLKGVQAFYKNFQRLPKMSKEDVSSADQHLLACLTIE